MANQAVQKSKETSLQSVRSSTLSSASHTTGSGLGYAAKHKDFGDRITEDLYLEDLQHKLRRENYKERFHKLLCWEEKEHIDILGKRCNGKYKVNYHIQKPDSIAYSNDRDYSCYCSVEEMSGDQIAYVTQCSEFADIPIPDHEQIKADILLINNHHTEDCLYLGLDEPNATRFTKFMEHTGGMYLEVQFEIKHSYFNNLHDAIESLSSEIIARLLPTAVDVKPLHAMPSISQSCYNALHLDTDSPGPQAKSVRLIASCPNSNPPFLITGSFGTGKTHLLAATTHHFLQQGYYSHQAVRVLVCAHHQASADAFIDYYFSVLKHEADYTWKEIVVRIISPHGNISRNAAHRYIYDTATNFCSNFIASKCANIVVVTTFLTSLHFRSVIPVGFFTHILLDETGQSREPEAVAPLCLATTGTKLVMAGDKMQVGPALLVFGQEAQQNGLNISLLERLSNIYDKLDSAQLQCVQLNANYRAHREIMNLASKLSYDCSLSSIVPDSIAHPDAPYPLLFVCSSLDDTTTQVKRDTDENEARVLLNQVLRFIVKWPTAQWGPENPSSVCIITPTKHQVSVIRRILYHDVKYSRIKGITMLPTFDIQGREFQAVFLGSIEPTDFSGMTCNPIKSICNQYVFNTVITRARSLVVSVGNPFMLLRMERGCSKTCWKEYLHLCSMNSTLITTECVNSDAEIQKLRMLIGHKIVPSMTMLLTNERNAIRYKEIKLTCKTSKEEVHVISSDGCHDNEAKHLVPDKNVVGSYATYSKSGCCIENREKHLDLIRQKLTVATYKTKFHELLVFEEEEHERILKARCDGTYQLVLIDGVPENLHIDEDTYTQYGYICNKNGNEWNGDDFAYATQATEYKNSMLISIMKHQINADIISLKNLQLDCYLWIGFDKSNSIQLLSIQKHVACRDNVATFDNVTVTFNLKHSYFNRMHRALDALSSQVIEILFPKPKAFHCIKHCQNRFCDLLDIQLDTYGQQQALNVVLSCQSTAITLITGAFGTGKTLLLAHSVYHVIEQQPNAKILICTHHHKSADAFVENYFGPMKENGWKPDLVRYSNRKSHSQFQRYWKQQIMIKDVYKLQVVVSTFCDSFSLQNAVKKGFFTHIFIDEAAQTREPETIIPLCLASSGTRIIIAGDHCQVGPALLVLGTEAQENGLKYSLLQRLHQHYENIGKCSESHCAVLLHNYRCHSSILRLPSSLFYNSTLQSMVPDDAHPDAPYPLLFVCSSINSSAKCTSKDSDGIEAELLLNEVMRFVHVWPEREWMERKLDTICIMTTSSNQRILIRGLINTKYKFLRGISVLTTYEMQGTEYRALFLSTHEMTLSDGRASNPTKSICDPYVFNTAITRAQSLVVSVGNPFRLLKSESYMEHKYRFNIKCWHEYLKHCIECKTLIIPQAQLDSDRNHLDAVIQLQSMLFSDAETVSRVVPLTHDSILAAYAKVFSKYPECRRAQIMISHINRNLTWTLSKDTSFSKAIDSLPHHTFCKQYECILSCSRFDKADAIPCDPNNHMVKLLGVNNRRGAFDGDTVLVGVFDDSNPEPKGRVVKCIKHCSTPLAFACHVDAISPILFVPLNNKDPKLLNLPNLSHDLMTRKSLHGLENGIRSTEVVIFKDTWDGQGLPQINNVISFAVARKMLFVVRVLCWNPKYRLPLGIVVAAIPQGISFFHALRLLKVEYNVPELQTTSLIPSDSVHKNPLLPLNEHTFTIDPENAQNLDDAISLVLVNTTEEFCTYEMAVHITNVAKHIIRDSEEDKRAKEAGLSVYGTRDSGCAHLLSSELRSKLTLSPGKVRDVISVACTVTLDDTNKPQLSKPEIKESQIVSQLQLTYESANNILNGATPAELSDQIDSFNAAQPSQLSLTNCLNMLYQIALEQRKIRLGQMTAFSYRISEDGDENCWQSHLLIEELMIWANYAIADKIYTSYPNCALLLRQLSPNNEEKSACLERHKQILANSLSHQALISKPVLASPITVPQFVINKLIDAVKNVDTSLITHLLTSDHYYPQLAVCQVQLQRWNHKAEYCCTSVTQDAEAIIHYNLKLDHYTHFTSPIRRHMDIYVQRLVMSSLHGGSEGDFPVHTFQDLCSHLNSRTNAAKCFESGLKRVSLGLKFTAQSFECYAFVKQCDKSAIDLYFPDLKFKLLTPKHRSIKINYLGMVEKNPIYAWRIKIFSFDDKISLWGYQTPVSSEPISEDKLSATYKIETFHLTEDSNFKKVHYYAKPIPDLVSIDAKSWKQLQYEACKTATVTANTEINHQSLKLLEDTKRLLNFHIKDVAAEQDPFITSSPLVNLYIVGNICTYDLVQVWMSWEAKDGLIAPCIQMVKIAPNAHMCIQHNSSPAQCFSDATLPHASKAQYNSISEYVALWEQLILAEGAEISVKQCQIVIIQNVILKWPNLVIPHDCVDDLHYVPQGCILADMPHQFQQISASFLNPIRIGDMVCVRYGTTPASKVKAVFHMVVTKLVLDVGKALSTIEMKIFGKQNSRISKDVRESLQSKCELQLIPMAISIQRVFSALSKLKSHDGSRRVSGIAMNIALGKFEAQHKCMTSYAKTALKIFKNDSNAHKLWSLDKPLNHVQSEAIKNAIKHPFYLIQGPPGTGKSETGAHLAYVFAMTNQQNHTGKCVLYCGPSNKAVDVVLGKFHKLVQQFPYLNLRLLRIYGQAIENNDFVGPDGWSGSVSDERSEYKCPDYSETYALHKLIRKSSFGQKIADLEKQLKVLGDNNCIAGIALQNKFNECVRSAKEEVLQQPFDIVLCTCNESCGRKVEMYIKPLQCIVDECAMAQEPETLAPISLCEHVVLIGDHKQLTPVINYLPAKACGLGTSLFQRYAELENYQHLCITLTIQYRMHAAIQQFPSKYFYCNKLTPADVIRSRKQIELSNFWPVQKMPVVFCDVVGSEGQNKALSKKRKKAALESKSNQSEAHKVVQIASRIHSITNNSTIIAILTPYSAQKETIIEEATRVNLLSGKKGQRERLKVATITESQGDEFDFVILSLVRSQPLQDIQNPENVWADRGWILQNLGFVTDQHQINVGITRSKFGLIIVGNKQLLKYDDTWKSLIADYEALGCVVHEESFPPQ